MPTQNPWALVGMGMGAQCWSLVWIYERTPKYMFRRILYCGVCCLSDYSSKSFQNHKRQTRCLNIRNSGTLRLLQRTKNLMRAPKARADHIALTFNQIGSLSTNCTYVCIFNVIIDDDVGSFQTSMSDAMGVQGFHPLWQFAKSQASSWHHGKASSL